MEQDLEQLLLPLAVLICLLKRDCWLCDPENQIQIEEAQNDDFEEKIH